MGGGAGEGGGEHSTKFPERPSVELSVQAKFSGIVARSELKHSFCLSVLFAPSRHTYDWQAPTELPQTVCLHDPVHTPLGLG